jgi:hypothetical protein
MGYKWDIIVILNPVKGLLNQAIIKTTHDSWDDGG